MLSVLRKLGRTEGSEIAEVAVVLPLVFTLLLGIIWFGRAFSIYATITQAAEQGAKVAARPACGSCPIPVPSWNNATSFPGDTIVQTTVSSVLQASSLDPDQMILYMPVVSFCQRPAPPGDCSTTSPPTVTICRSVILNPSTAVPPPPQQCGTIVSFQYPFKMNLPFTSLNMRQIVLKAQAQSRMEN